MEDDPLLARAAAAIEEARRLRKEAERCCAEAVHAYEAIYKSALGLRKQVEVTAGQAGGSPAPSLIVDPRATAIQRGDDAAVVHLRRTQPLLAKGGPRASPTGIGRAFDRRRQG